MSNKKEKKMSNQINLDLKLLFFLSKKRNKSHDKFVRVRGMNGEVRAGTSKKTHTLSSVKRERDRYIN